MKTTYTSWDDFEECREGKPHVVRLLLCALDGYFTPIDNTNKVNSSGEKVCKESYAIAGIYGDFLRNADYGFRLNDYGIRLWDSYSEAQGYLERNLQSNKA